jgi:lipoprotein-anchoring transpeptidase ErfK/SrfK
VNTLKSAAVVIVLLVVLYGVYVALNKPDFFSAPPTPGADVAPPVVEFGPAGVDSGSPHTVSPSLAPVGSQASPATGASRTVSGGSFQPGGEGSSLPPPTSVPTTAPPLDPTASAGGGLTRSNYEVPAGGSQAPPLDLQPSAPSAESAPGGSAALTAYSLRRDWKEVEQLVADAKFKAALAKLSPYYVNADVPAADRGQLVAWLDALAAKVIYSREHLLESPYRVRRSDRLYEIARQYNIPWPLLARVNGLDEKDADVVAPGTELKIVPGPFRADVNLATHELTLFLGEMYAGRFPFSMGEHQLQPGQYQVKDKRNDYPYYGLDGRVIPNNDPSNPYGGFWLSLGGELSIHGSPLSPGARPLGCVSLSPQDARDVYSILSLGSEVTVRK